MGVVVLTDGRLHLNLVHLVAIAVAVAMTIASVAVRVDTLGWGMVRGVDVGREL